MKVHIDELVEDTGRFLLRVIPKDLVDKVNLVDYNAFLSWAKNSPYPTLQQFYRATLPPVLNREQPLESIDYTDRLGVRWASLDRAAEALGITVGHLRNDYLPDLTSEQRFEAVQVIAYRDGELKTSKPAAQLFGSLPKNHRTGGFEGANHYLPETDQWISSTEDRRGFDPGLEPVGYFHQSAFPEVVNVDALLEIRERKRRANQRTRHSKRGSGGMFVKA